MRCHIADMQCHIADMQCHIAHMQKRMLARPLHNDVLAYLVAKQIELPAC